MFAAIFLHDLCRMWFIAKPFRSPGALNVEIDGMWMGTSNARITTIVDNNGWFSMV